MAHWLPPLAAIGTTGEIRFVGQVLVRAMPTCLNGLQLVLEGTLRGRLHVHVE